MAYTVKGFDKDRYLQYLRTKQNVSDLINRIGKYRQDSYDEKVRDYERERQDAIRESMKHEQDDVRAEKQYRRYIDQKEKYDKAVAAQTARDMRGDDVRMEKQYTRAMDALEQQRKALDKQRQFDVSGNDVRQEKQYKRYLDALEQQKKLQAKANRYAVSGDDVRQEKKYNRYLDQVQQQNEKVKDWQRYMTGVNKDEKAMTRAEGRYLSAVESARKLAEQQPEKAAELKKAEDFQEWLDILAQMNQAKKNTNNVFKGDMDYSKWMGQPSEGVRNALQVGNAQRATKQWWADREAGKLGQNGDIAGMNQEQRNAYRKQLEEEKAKASASVDAHGRAGGVNYNGILDLYNNEEIRQMQEILNGNYSEEEKQKAEERLYMLRNGERDDYGRSAAERANEALWRLENEYDPDDKTEQTRDAQRRMVYDLMNGDGAYDGLDAEERQQVDAAIDQATGNVLSGQSDHTLLENEKSNVRTINNLLKQLDYQDELERRYNELMAGEIEGDGTWDPAYSVKHEEENDAWDTMSVGSNVDDVYNLLNPETANWTTDITDTGVGAALLMDDEMKEKFISLYKANKKDEAWAFFEGVLPYLNQAYHYFEKTKQEEEASRNPVISTLGTMAAHVMQPAEFLANLPAQIKALINGEQSGVTDPYSSNYALARYKNTVRNKIAENIGDMGWMYSGIMSGVDSGLNVAIGKGLGLTDKALEYGVLALFFTQSFDTSLQNAMVEGNGNFAYDVAEAFIDSAIDTVTEIASVERWLADPTNIMTYLIKVGVSEASEEAVGAIAEPYIKQILGHKHQYNERADQIWAQGGYNDANGNFIKVKDWDDAKRQALREWNHDIRMAAQQALLSVGPAGVYGSFQIAQNNRNVGRTIQNQQYENGATGLDTVLEAAKGLDTTTKSFQEAQKIGEKLEQNKKVRPGKVGQLASDVMRESQEQAEQKAADALRNEVRKELAGKEIRGSNAEEMTDLIVKALDAGGIENLTKKERDKIHDSAVGYNTLVKFQFASEQSSRAVAAQTEATQAERKAMQSVSDALTQKKTQTAPDDFVGKQLATQDDIDRAEGKRTQRPDEIIVDRKFGKLEGMEPVQTNGRTEWKYRVNVDGETRLMDAGEIKATNFSTAAILRNQTLNPGFYSGSYTNELLKQVNSQPNTRIGDYMREAVNVRLKAFLGKAIPQTTAMTEAQAKEIYRLSMEDSRTEWQNESAGRTANFLGEEKGQASFDGAEFGSEEWEKKLDGMELSQADRDAVNGLAGVAVQYGLKFNFVPQINNNDYIHGSEAQDGITIALKSYDSETARKAGRKHDIIVTVGHEMTHWLRRNNAAGYIELQDYVLKAMMDRGVNVEDRILTMMERRAGAGDMLNISGALEEIVANACDQVMASQEAADYLQKNSPKLYDKIRNYVKDLVKRITSLFKTGEAMESASRDSWMLASMGRQVNDLHKLWWGKFDEVLSGQVKQLESAQEEGTERVAASVAEERFSMAEGEQADEVHWTVSEDNGLPALTNAEGDVMAEELPGGSITMYSYASWKEDDIDELVQKLVERGFSKRKVNKWVKDVNSIAAIIASDRGRYDYLPAQLSTKNKTMLKNNQEYIKTLDASTLCAKRLLYQGIFNEIQHLLPNTPLLPGDLIDLVNKMKKNGLVTPCAICYVESRRRMLGSYAQKWVNEYKGEYVPRIEEVTTTDGLEKLRTAHPQAYQDFIDAMNAKGSANPKVVQLRTDYKSGEIRNLTENQIKKVKEIGGLRVQSFSDFETIHLIDMMQAVMDMAAMDLTSQAYTKVPNFAWVFGDTGIKINLSLIGEGTGVDENGNLVFSDTEGMPFNEAMELRKNYSKNVGTILVGMNDEHIIAAMGDERIDFIIPFHKSGWSKREMGLVYGMNTYKDYTKTQNEKKIAVNEKGEVLRRSNGRGYATIPNKTSKISNFQPVGPNGYWDFSKSGEWNAENYLKLCAEDKRLPKFPQFLVDNGDGSYSLPTGNDKRSENIRKGYWKLLIDFKMYDNEGKGSPQTTVQPYFNMDVATEIMRNYDEDPNALPTNHKIAQEFVDEYKAKHPGRTSFSIAEGEDGDVGHWMMGLTESSVHTEGERALIREYRGLKTSLELCRKRQDEYMDKIAELQAKSVLTAEERDTMIILQNKLQVQQDKQARLEQELYDVTRSEGYAGMMYRNSRIFDDYINGKNQQQVEAAVDSLINEAEQAEKNIEKRQKAIRRMAEDAAVNTIRKELKSRGLSWAANGLKKNYFTAMSTGEIEGRLAEIVLKAVNGEEIGADIESLANDMVTNVSGWGSEIAEEALSNVRGMTIEIGPGQQAEMKANHLTLKDLRERTKGSGVTFKYGTRSTLDVNAEEIGDLIPDLRESLKNEKGSLVDFVEWIERQLESKKGNAQDYGVNPDEVAVVITACAQQMLDAEQGGMSPADLRKRIEAAQGEIGKLEEAVAGLMASAQEIKNSAMKASNATGGLRADAVAAIDYYNLIAKQAAEVERNRVKRTVIDELRSENTRKLIEQQMKFNELLKKDKRARELQKDNESLRKEITTNVKRVKERLLAETDLKNIQEEAKPLARTLVSMFVDHDMAGFRHVLFSDKRSLVDAQERLAKMEAANGPFDMDADLDFLVIKAPNPEDNDYSLKDKVLEDLMHIEQGLVEYRTAEGRGNVSLADRKAALEKIQEAVSEIYDVIKARETAFIMGQKRNVLELATQMEKDMMDSRFKGERRGRGSQVRDWFWNDVGYGNLTPEYFFKNLRNRTMSLLHEGMHEAEKRSGLEARDAKARMEQIAKITGYANWDGQEKKTVTLSNGKKIEMTVEQLMALYATWNREQNQLRPEETSHLLKGGFVLAEGDTREGKARREKIAQRPIRVNEMDLGSIGRYLTEEQKNYVDMVVGYMSSDLAQLGNEASLRTYGIKKFTESYYFPTKSWGGVLNQSSASGVTNNNDNRAMRQSFSKRVRAGANNALEIGDFTATAMKHITGMITFNTVGPAVENMNKVLNQQLDYFEDEEMDPDEAYKRNMRAAFQENYGKMAYNYLTQFMKDVNGGVARRNETIMREKLLSLFKKNAVAGSLSVAAQQPLSYIRAAMLINPKYLAAAISPQYWRGSYEEMMSHSGVAVIKEMGRFDMNFGQSMTDYITPEGMKTVKDRIKAAGEVATALPGKMDAMTWTRMWSACKLEQAALHPEMDRTSEDFLDMVADRFEEVMRRTQVYDSVMVKSQNMRSDNYINKIRTSFMAEPTLSLNVLADAWINKKEKGGKANAARALATFILSAAAQAGAKAFFGTGRSPDKKKTKEENFLNKFLQNLLSEANPFGLIPGYSQVTEAFINGELNDDAMGMIGKAKDTVQRIVALASGDIGKKGLYRDLEDSVGQLVQIATDVPLKNFMRDFRAMVNWFSGGTATGLTGDSYADRETSAAVLKQQSLENLMTKELGGLLSSMMGDAGYKTDNTSYVKRIYDAQKKGDEQTAGEIREYMEKVKLNGKDPGKWIDSQLNALLKEDNSLSEEEKLDALNENGYGDMSEYIKTQFMTGSIDRKTAEEQYRKAYPNKTDKDVTIKFDGLEWEKEGKPLAYGQKNFTGYTKLYVAMENNSSSEIQEAATQMLKIGYDAKSVKSDVNGQMHKLYNEAQTADYKRRIQDAMNKAYKALGFTVEEAEKTVQKWIKEKKNK